MDILTAITDYLLDIKHLGEKTQILYQSRLTVFSQWCIEQNIQLEQINNRNVQRFLEHVKATHKPHKTGRVEISSRTLVGYVSIIWTFLYWCLDVDEYENYVKLKTVKRIKMPRHEAFIKQTFTNEELEALFQACTHPSKEHEYQLRDTAILALLLDAGLRSAELRTLSIGNVVLAEPLKEDNYIVVMGKGRKQREIPLGNRAVAVLSRYLREYRQGASKTDTVFISRDRKAGSRRRGQLSHEGLRDILERLRELSTLSSDLDVNPHKFRHTFATCFMANGGDIYTLSRLLGHTSVAITEKYLKTLSARAIRQRKHHHSVLDTL